MRERTLLLALLLLPGLLVRTGTAQGFEGTVEKVVIEQDGQDYE